MHEYENRDDSPDDDDGQRENFVRLVNRYPYDMDLRSGRYVVDAKSILGIFSIDLARPITMTIYSDDCDDLLRDLDGYRVKDGEETAAK